MPSTSSGTDSFCGTAPRKEAAAAAIGPTPAKPSSSPRSAESSRVRTSVEFFYLDKDELTENDTGTRILGGNYEFSRGEDTTIGATYMKLSRTTDDEAGA